jgi:hypothetical protein
MAYIINKFNGEQLLVLEDGTLNNDLSVGLLGKNTIGYGEVQNENFIHLLENFAGNAPPSGQTLRGQVYFNTQTNQLNVYDGARWNIVGNATSSDLAPDTTTNGSLWLNTKTNQLFVYQDGNWVFVGPEGVDGFGETRAAAVIVKDTQDSNRPIIKLTVNGQTIAVCSSSSFTISPSENLTGFTTIRGGITLSSSVDIRGSLDGNATSATKLLSSRRINGVNFDGTSDITISATSTQPLKSGEFIVGEDFTGAIEQTWRVDATVENRSNKIVARDELGNFAAGTISANLTGNVTGNVSTLSGTSQFNDIVARSVTSSNITGNISGNAGSANRLQFARSINGVLFDGTENITLKSSTTASLVPGPYIVGDSFDGSSVKSWGVSASSTNIADNVVARDANGNFTAGTITANLIGNVSGNVNVNSGTSSFNLVSATQFTGNLVGSITGNAASATRLQFLRSINGVPFDGTENITLTANTPNTLSRGQYLTGNSFNGSSAAIWAVDATPSNVSNKVVARDGAGNFAAGTITASLIGNTTGTHTGPVNGNTNGTHIGSVIGNVSGNVTGNLVGNVSGNVTGSASLNVLKTGDTLTGDLQISKPNSWLTLRSSSTGPNGTNQAAGISIGESGYKGSASLHITYTGDGFSHIGMGPVDANTSIMQHRAMRLYYLNNTVDFFGTINVPTVNATTLSGNGSAITSLNAANLSSGTVPSARLSGSYSINISGSASSNVLKSGDTMTGFLTLSGSPTLTNHAATKGYVDAVAANTFIIQSGASFSVSGFTNQVGSWNFNRNWFDVFPPAGKIMGNLAAFIPSINQIHFAGNVNGDDSMVCTYAFLADRIRVYVQNTEQRSTPAANWLAVWR